jgi:hypothetical protein
MASVAEEITSLLAQLPPSEQERVPRFARELAHPPVFPHTPLPPGTPPDALLRIRVDPEVGAAMEAALEECERIDPDE